MTRALESVSFTREHGLLYRIVESQESVATTSITPSLSAQSRLEEMIEGSKPALEGGMARFGYLLSTPFRYPPLKYGSRFGSASEPSLFYGSLREATCIAEAGFYRFIFHQSMSIPPPNPVRTQHSLFAVGFRTSKGVDLCGSVYKADRDKIMAPDDYAFTHKLGRFLREQGAQCLLYPSARDPERGTNVAIYTPKVFASKEPRSLALWQSEVDEAVVTFSAMGVTRSYRFNRAQFADAMGRLLFPG